MPDTLQFTNGNQIVHHYDAMGNRLRTTYYTRKVALVEPATNTIPGTDNLQEYNMVSYITLGNKRYVRYGHDGWGLQYVYNPEGYIKYWGEEEHYPYYYIKDHLGSVRETYIRPYVNEKYCEQRMQYYPSGLPWNTNLSPSYQPFKYGSKEFVEMHGLDEYDSEARWYYPAIMRTTTMDPMCEKYYSTSPYTWCGNNPVSYVDPDGRDTLKLESNGLVQSYIQSNTGKDVIMICKANGETVCAPLELPLHTMSLEFNVMKKDNDGESERRLFAIKVDGDDDGKNIYKYIVDNTSGTYEWGIIQTGEEKIGTNFISTSSQQGRISTNGIILKKNAGISIRNVVHSHPSDNEASDTDKETAATWYEKGLVSVNTEFFIYYVPEHRPIQYFRKPKTIK